MPPDEDPSLIGLPHRLDDRLHELETQEAPRQPAGWAPPLDRLRGGEQASGSRGRAGTTAEPRVAAGASASPADQVAGDDDEIDVRSYLAVLRRRWRTIAVIVVLFVAAGVGRSLAQDERYKASATLLIRPPAAEAVVDSSSSNRSTQQLERDLNNEAELLRSDAVVKAVDEAYDGPLHASRVTAKLGSQASDVVTVSMTASDPKEAAELVNTYVDTFIEVRRKAKLEELFAASAEVQARIEAVDKRATDITAPLELLDAQVTADPTNEALRQQRDDLRDRVQAQLTPIESQRSYYAQQLDGLQLSAQIADRGGAEVLTRATVPDDPVSPKPVRDGVIALVLGLAAAIGIAFLRDSLDDRIRTTADLDRAVGGLPTLALVPHYDISGPERAVVVGRGKPTPAAEAFRSLRTSVRFAALDHPIKVLQVTSASDGEGKSTTAANLAMAFAQGGDRVAVVGCDLRRPQVHRLFGADLAPGLTDVIVDDAGVEAALRRIEPGAYLLPAGSPPPNPSELLSTSRAVAVISALAEELDLVILDCSPVLPVTDALVVSRLADATVVVASARRTKRHALRRAVEQLRHVNAPILGVVLNSAPLGEEYGYGYHHVADREGAGRRRGRSGDGPRPTSTSEGDGRGPSDSYVPAGAG